MEPDIERHTRSNTITKYYNMKRLTNDNFQGRHEYVTPFVSETQIEALEVLCSSTSNPGSDFVEDMTTGDKFDNWI